MFLIQVYTILQVELTRLLLISLLLEQLSL